MSSLVTISGLPLHPLVVHVVVVVVPCTAIAAICMAFLPRFSHRFGPLIAIGAVISIGSAVLAKEAGEQLARVVSVTPEHLQWGSRAPLWISLFGLAALGFWFVDRGIPSNRPRPVWLKACAGGVVVLALMAMVQVLGAGHSGAEAVWLPVIQ